MEPIQDAIEFMDGAFGDFEDEIDEFCTEFGNLGENICLSLGLPASFCNALKDAPDPNDSILKKVIRRKQQMREERRRGISRSPRYPIQATTYGEINWMEQYTDDQSNQDESHTSTDADQEKWERRTREYEESTQHPVAYWYYRLTKEEHRVHNPKGKELKDMILGEIRREKIEHLFYLAQNPFGRTYSANEHINKKIESHNRVIRRLFDKTFVVDPKSTRRKVGLTMNKYKWDDNTEYAEAYRHMEGNASAILMQSVALFGRVEWMKDEARLKYPERHEIIGHMELMQFPSYLQGILQSMGTFVRKYNEPNLLDLDRMVKLEAQRHAAMNPIEEQNLMYSQYSSKTDENGVRVSNIYDGAPSIRHRHLYMSQEEKKSFRDLAERYRWYRDTPSVHIGAHLKTMMMLSFTSLMAPHLVDPVVNELATRGPAFDAPLTKYLRHFGLTRHMHNITKNVRQWRVRKLHQEEMSDGELRVMLNPNQVKIHATRDIKYPYDRLYNGEDYRKDYDQAQKFLAGEIVDLDKVVISRNIDGTPKRVRSNALAKEITPRKIDEIHRVLPFTMDLAHPAFKPMTRTETLTRMVKVQERIAIGTTVTSTIVPIAKVIMENPQMILTFVYPMVISPMGQATSGLWARFGLRQFEKIFQDYLDFSVSEIENVALDAAETLVYNLIYALNFLEYLIMGTGFALAQSAFAWVAIWLIGILILVICMPVWFIVAFFLFWISMVFPFLINAGIAGSMAIGSVPPPPNVDGDGIPTQAPLIGYPHDLIFCNSSEGTCTTSEDCIGGGFCDCPEDKLFEYRNFLFTIENTDPCGVPFSGTCKCWPQFKCDGRVPIAKLANIITPDCEGEFGYDFRGQVWYASDGGFWAKTWTIIRASMINLWVQIRFFVRALLVGWLGFIDRGTGAFLAVAVSLFILIMVRKPIWFFAFTIMAIGLWYFPSAPGDFYIEYILPTFESFAAASITITTVGWIDSIINQFIDWLWIDELFKGIINFTRFPNHSINDPLGLPRLSEGEVTCFIIGLFSGFPGVLFLLVTGVALLMTFATGLFWLLVTLVIQFLWLLAQWIWAWLWLSLAVISKQERFKNIHKYVTNKATNPRLKRLARRLKLKMEESGSAESLAATSRASMNYWIPLPAPSRAQLHTKINKERDEARREISEMKQEVSDMKKELKTMRRRSGGSVTPSTDDTHPEYTAKTTTNRGKGSSIIPTIIPLYPSTTSTTRTHGRGQTENDLETGAGVGGSLRAPLSGSALTRAKKGFQGLWNTIRPDADTDKKFE
ncbi:MAG: hypothetical protein ACTSUE_13035 [Promethearchaeota archaeon]